jgi:hypothetical protein
VSLRPDQYSVMRGTVNTLFNLFVTRVGDVCAHPAEKPVPKEAVVVFAQAWWLRSYGCDEGGYPLFHGVRGVCAKIIDPAPVLPAQSSFARLVQLTKTFAASFFSGEESGLSLPELMDKRLRLYERLVLLENNAHSDRILARVAQATLELQELCSHSAVELECTGGDTSRFSPAKDFLQKLSVDFAPVVPELQRLRQHTALEGDSKEKEGVKKELSRLTILLETLTIKRASV